MKMEVDHVQWLLSSFESSPHIVQKVKDVYSCDILYYTLWFLLLLCFSSLKQTEAHEVGSGSGLAHTAEKQPM